MSVIHSTAIQSEATQIAMRDGRTIELLVDFPPGQDRFPTVVFAPGQRYPMDSPLFQHLAAQLSARGVAVYRFNWTHTVSASGVPPHPENLASRVAVMEAVLEHARSDRRVRTDCLLVGGKSLGSIVAWCVFMHQPTIRAGVFLTPVCSAPAADNGVPVCLTGENYPSRCGDARPALFIAGTEDALCSPPLLYRFAEEQDSPVRVALIGGNHGFIDPADVHTERNIELAALITSNFAQDVVARG